jgi:hypothetical protein
MDGNDTARTGEKEDQDIGHEELREGDRGERGGVGETVEEGVAEQRREDAERQRQAAPRWPPRKARQRQRVAEAPADQVGDRLPVGEAFAEVAAQRHPTTS